MLVLILFGIQPTDELVWKTVDTATLQHNGGGQSRSELCRDTALQCPTIGGIHPNMTREEVLESLGRPTLTRDNNFWIYRRAFTEVNVVQWDEEERVTSVAGSMVRTHGIALLRSDTSISTIRETLGAPTKVEQSRDYSIVMWYSTDDKDIKLGVYCNKDTASAYSLERRLPPGRQYASDQPTTRPNPNSFSWIPSDSDLAYRVIPPPHPRGRGVPHVVPALIVLRQE